MTLAEIRTPDLSLSVNLKQTALQITYSQIEIAFEHILLSTATHRFARSGLCQVFIRAAKYLIYILKNLTSKFSVMAYALWLYGRSAP